MEDIILFTVVGSPTMVARSVDEDKDAIYVEYPFILYRESDTIVASPYMPLAEDGIVAFKKDNLVATAVAPKYVTKHYNRLVKELKDIKYLFKQSSEKNQDEHPFSAKTLKTLH